MATLFISYYTIPLGPTKKTKLFKTGNHNLYNLLNEYIIILELKVYNTKIASPYV